MIEKTQGIVLHSFKYGETSIIARVFTREKGVQSYIIPGARKTRSKIRANLFQPLTMLSLVVYYKEKSGLQHIREASCPRPCTHIPFDIRKSSVAIFLADIITHALKEHDANPEMFDFMEAALVYFDQAVPPPPDFHLHFLVLLCRHLGFQPAKNHSGTNCYFNMKEGTFQAAIPGQDAGMDRELSSYLHALNTTNIEEGPPTNQAKHLRRALLDKIVTYYQLHLDGFKHVVSHIVLEEIMR